MISIQFNIAIKRFGLIEHFIDLDVAENTAEKKLYRLYRDNDDVFFIAQAFHYP